MAGSSARRPEALLLTCEHGGSRVPRALRPLFAGPGARRQRAGHRGVDRGALRLARHLARALRAPLRAATTTRLVVDLNRSPRHPRVLGPRLRTLPRRAREAVLARHHRPHREAVRRAVSARARRGGRTLHVAVHSFTPVLAGRRRRMDVGLLYDPARPAERALCARWKALLEESAPELRVRRNAPYRGTSDGLPTALRAAFPARHYLGVELEVSQALLADPRRARRVAAQLAASLARLRAERRR